jgi:tRNA U34 5-methylaminomethyl-2-thiouridine-forming methyltransferase MnmC
MIKISENFTFRKIKSDFNNYIFDEKFDLIYFDAFAPEKQPAMWSIKNFTKIYDILNNNGILTTYSSKGIVKNNLRNAGFKVTRLNGPKGKRHILRALKLKI